MLFRRPHFLTVRLNLSIVVLAAALIAVTTAGCERLAPVAAREFIALNALPIASTTNLEDLADLDFLLPHLANDSGDIRVVLYGEAPHGTLDHPELFFRLLVFLNEQAGFRYLAPETDFAYTRMLNQYLTSGDPTLLDQMDQWTYPCSANSKTNREFWEKLFAFNQTLPEERKIRVMPTDISHGLGYALNQMVRLRDQMASGPLLDSYQAIWQNKQTLPELLAAAVATEQFLHEHRDQLRTMLSDYDHDRFLAYSARKTLEIKNEPNSRKRDAMREAMIKEYFQWHIEQAGGDPNSSPRVLAYYGGYHVSKAGESSESYTPVGTWLAHEYEWSKNRVFSIYAASKNGQYLVPTSNGMKTAAIDWSFLGDLAAWTPESHRISAISTVQPGVGNTPNPLQTLGYNDRPLGTRYDWLFLLKDVRPAVAFD